MPTATAAPQLSGQVVYHARLRGDANDIFVLDLSTGKSQQITNSGTDNIEASWSHDGDRIAFACKEDKTYQICSAEADGTQLHQLTHNQFNAWGPRWSPDGTKIVYVGDRPAYSHLYILDLQTGDSKRLLASPGNEGAPDWSPDGKEIIFMSDRNKQFCLYSVRPDGAGEQQITNFGQDDRPRWSPDGKQLVFRRQIEQSAFHSGSELFIADADGKNARSLTQDQDAEDWPTWSPDGKWILFTIGTVANSTLAVIPSDSVAPTQRAPLSVAGANGRAPDWKP